jgi:hypothetical protein
MKSNRTGRPCKLTLEVRKIILDAIAAGGLYKHAAALGGVSRITLNNWLNKGKRAKRGEFFDFLIAVKRAEANAVINAVVRIQKAAEGGELIEDRTRTSTRTYRDGSSITVIVHVQKWTRPAWQAAAWFLERRCPEDYGRNAHQLRELRKIVGEMLRAELNRQKQGDGEPIPSKCLTVAAQTPMN